MRLGSRTMQVQQCRNHGEARPTLWLAGPVKGGAPEAVLCARTHSNAQDNVTQGLIPQVHSDNGEHHKAVHADSADSARTASVKSVRGISARAASGDPLSRAHMRADRPWGS